MENIVRKENKKISMSEFSNLLRSHKWLHEANSFQEAMEYGKKESEIQAIAWFNGPRYVEAYIRKMQNNIKTKIDEGHQKGFKYAEDIYASEIETGDKDFDNFRTLVKEFDWYYSFSDDINVYRKGKKAEQAILDIVADKKGIYETYWKYFSNKKIKNI